MSDFFRGGRELPQGQNYARLIIQNRIKSKTNLILSNHEETESEKLSSDEQNSYASYLASLIYDYQLKLKYAGIGLLTFLTMLSFDFAYAQETTPSEIVPLQIGDTIPEYFWVMSHLFYNNGKLETKTLSELKGRPFIIDFWSSWCGACINSLKRIDELKQNVDDTFNIIAVTSQDLSNVEKFLSFNKDINQTEFESIITDKLLSKFFEHHSLPHVIWVNDRGVVVRSSISYYVTIDNLKRLSENGCLNEIPLKIEDLHFDPTKQLVSNRGDNYSILRPILTGVKTQTIAINSWDIDKSRLAYVNYPAMYLYLIGYGLEVDFPKSRIRIQKENFRRNYFPSDPQARYTWREKNTYMYETVYPKNKSSEQINKQLIYDLDTFFNVNSSFDEKLMDCVVITSYTYSDSNSSINLASIESTIRKLNDNESNCIVINEGNIKGKVPRIDHITDWSPRSVLELLKSVGFEVHIARRSIKLLEFKERRERI